MATKHASTAGGGMQSLLAVDARILSDIRKELREITLLVDAAEVAASQESLRLSSPTLKAPPAPVEVPERVPRSSVRKKWKTAVRQVVFMGKTKEKLQESYENDSVLRLRDMSALSLLCALPIFQDLDGAALLDLHVHVKLQSFAAGMTLFSRDHLRAVSSIFVIRSGTAWVKAAGVQRTTTDEFHVDDFLCESGDVIDPAECLAKDVATTCVAVGAVDAFTIPHEVLAMYRDKLPRLSETMDSVRYPDKESESFRKWARQTSGCLRYEAKAREGDMAPQAFIREILLSVSPELDLDHCIQCMARLFLRVFRAKATRLYLLNAKASHFTTKFASDSDDSQGVQCPTSVGIPGLVFHSQTPLHLAPDAADAASMPQVDWEKYRRRRVKSIMAVPVFQPHATDVVMAVWEVLSDADVYSTNELQLLELAATFMQPYLTQCDRPARRLGSVVQIETSFSIKPKTLRLATLASVVYVTAGLYHGDQLLAPLVTSPKLTGRTLPPSPTSGGGIHDVIREFTFKDEMTFACHVQSLPRAAHMAWTVHSAKKATILGMSRCCLFSYDHFFRTGLVSLKVETSVELPIEYEDCLLPPNHTSATYLLLEFPSYQHPLTYRSNESEVSRTVPAHADVRECGQLAAFEKDPMRALSESDRSFFWNFRDVLVASPAALMPFLLSVDWANRAHVMDAYKYLYLWSAPTYLQALQLLNRKFPDPFVRAYAVRCLDSLPDYRLRLYLLQLVQALKYEPHHDSALMRFLFVRAMKSPGEVGYALFWLLQAELHLPAVQARFRLLSTQYLCHCGTYRLELYQSMYVMRFLQTVATQVKAAPTKAAGLEILHTQLGRAIVPDCFQLPLHPNVFYTAFVTEKCRVMDSAKKPLFLSLTPMKPQSYAPLQAAIFKSGDDLRQDQLTLQLLRVMDDLWKTAGLDLKVSAYACVSTGDNMGFIQVVAQASTLASICWDRHRQKKHFRKWAAVKTALWGKKVFTEWLAGKSDASRDEIVANFVLSSAGYCVATYVLGIGDRHNDNLMLTETGHFLHIDFGHFLGHYKTYMGYKRERAPFVLTPAMAQVMGDQYDAFKATCVQAYLVLRANASLLITLLELALSSGIPELTPETIPWLANTLLLELGDDDAKAQFEALIEDALATVTTRINHATHILAH
ncbi:Aste57867_12512 [Aphanomyces stellatus]|uniref:Aste57867_12512 protein n=1 Tax=Aphanomyces stellatus TaxID=120398 RepID=A0A485KXR3_9STRA|nr:hypothetical protein As57867_012466 [Aphanomyces stellatus]VFT89363.1 Aste57867_12512 [Aphanomyces stellatus]